MANKFLAPRNGNKINEEGMLLGFITALAGGQNKGKVESTALQVQQASPTANMTVDILAGHFFIPYLSYGFPAWNVVTQNLTIAASNPSNPRTSRIVAYGDLSVADIINPNTPDGLKLMEVAGVASSVPVTPSDSAVQTAVGASNPWQELSRINVRANTTSILTTDITDFRSAFQIGGAIGGILLTQNGTLTVATNVASAIVTPKPGFFTQLFARVQTPSAGQAITGAVNKNGVQVATFIIPAGTANISATGLSITFAAGDYFTLDISQIGSTTPGASLVIALG